MTRVALLGSTGSIGTQALQVARHLGSRIRIVALAGGHNAALLSEQIAEFHPSLYHSLVPAEVAFGDAVAAGLEEMATDERVDTVIIATSGRAGLKPALAALAHGKRVALANKEVLVMAGGLVMEAARRAGATIMPVDSEHSAVWQCLRGESNAVRRILLTASGGPFYHLSQDLLEGVSASDALAHPVWAMGPKITVDSATLMNKGLEVIEAHWLFDMPYQQIEVVAHPECLVHSMVEFVDGSVKAQLSTPDMMLPIQHALTYPDRLPGETSPLAWDRQCTLTFSPVDIDRFPCLRVARQAGEAGGTYAAALCGADEAAVSLFLRGEIRFPGIGHLVERALAAHVPGDAASLDAIVEADDWAREYVLTHHIATD